jgi:hypothetical protein
MEDNFEINFEEFESSEAKNSEAISEVFKNEIRIFKEFFDISTQIIS